MTICTQGKRCVLSDIVGEGLAPPEVRLTPYGKIADDQIRQIETRYPSIRVDHYVIMPNHIHMLLSLHREAGEASPSPTVVDVVRVFKSMTTRMCGCGAGLFQRSFHDHVIRGKEDWREIWEYIERNPLNWANDRFYVKKENRHDFAQRNHRRKL